MIIHGSPEFDVETSIAIAKTAQGPVSPELKMDFVKLAQNHKTNEQKMLEALESIRDMVREFIAMAQPSVMAVTVDDAPIARTAGFVEKSSSVAKPAQKMFVRGKR